MTIDTWGITTTFTKPLPLLSCIINYVQISTDPAVANATFKLTINLADPALPQPIREMRSDLNRTAGVDDCSSKPIIDLVGPSWGNKTDSAGETFEFFIGGSTGILDPAPQNTILQCP